MLDDENISRAEFAYVKLREAIRGKVLLPGQRLKEADLATRFDISRTPVREAIRRLTSDGLVQLTPRGLSVTTLSKQQVREVYYVREVLEGAAAELAALSVTASDISAMKDLVLSFQNDISPEEAARRNSLFHQAILDAAHNEFLSQALARLADTLSLLPRTTFETPGRIASAMHEHLEIIKAFEKHNAAAAQKAARKHIEIAGMVRIRMMFDDFVSPH